MSAHTPGPWEAVGAGVYAENPDGCREIVFSQHNTRSGTREEQRANAQLIAAAPELRSIAESLAAWCDDPDGYCGDLADLGQVAKALLARMDGAV